MRQFIATLMVFLVMSTTVFATSDYGPSVKSTSTVYDCYETGCSEGWQCSGVREGRMNDACCPIGYEWDNHKELCLRDCVDSDGDGFGVIARPDCRNPNKADCDDTNKDIKPYTKEICGNDVDENCDGGVDEGCPIQINTNIDIDKVAELFAKEDNKQWSIESITDTRINKSKLYSLLIDPSCQSSKETCDKIDNDCDGRRDEGCIRLNGDCDFCNALNSTYFSFCSIAECKSLSTDINCIWEQKPLMNTCYSDSAQDIPCTDDPSCEEKIVYEDSISPFRTKDYSVKSTVKGIAMALIGIAVVGIGVIVSAPVWIIGGGILAALSSIAYISSGSWAEEKAEGTLTPDEDRRLTSNARDIKTQMRLGPILVDKMITRMDLEEENRMKVLRIAEVGEDFLISESLGNIIKIDIPELLKGYGETESIMEILMEDEKNE